MMGLIRALLGRSHRTIQADEMADAIKRQTVQAVESARAKRLDVEALVIKLQQEHAR